jgi:hypothetical protein
VTDPLEPIGTLEGCIAESLAELDDGELLSVLDHPKCGTPAREELQRRKRYEAAWSGGWKSGPWSPVPRPPLEYQHIIEGARRGEHRAWGKVRSREEVRRSEHRKWLALSRSANKVEREAALHVLRTCYNKSRS